MMKSFTNFLVENFKIEKERYPGHHNNVVHNHYIRVGDHNVKVTYEEQRGPVYTRDEFNQLRDKYQNIPDHYNVIMQVDGKISRHGKRARDTNTQLGIFRAVTQSMKEFKDEVNPKKMEFSGDSKYKHKYWGKLGAKIAKRLGGEFDKYPDSWQSHHTIAFRKKK
jgi:hypothetical protein